MNLVKDAECKQTAIGRRCVDEASLCWNVSSKGYDGGMIFYLLKSELAQSV